MDKQIETIAAISTGGEGGISIIRVSGPETFAIADQVFRPASGKPSDTPNGRYVYGHVVDNQEVIDEAILLVMRNPRSYTREDMVEIQGHGGRVAAQRILRACIRAGARLAEPGEYTKRAFLNGRIDLLQAEAVLDLIQSASDRAARAAIEQLQGSLSRGFETLYDSILEIHARVELLLDFTEEHLIAQAATDLPERIRQIQEFLRATMRSFEEGRLLRTGAKVVIVGRPNAGKSTLLNALLGCERAIVSEMPGTTRDSIEESVLIDGIQVRLVDTAGIRATQCPVELTGIRQTKARIEQADLILFVLSTAEPADQEIVEEISIMPCDRTLFILNKQDIQIHDHLPLVEGFENIHISLKKAGTADAVKRLISTKLSSGIQGADMPHAVISERHKKLLERVEQEIAEALILARKEDEEHLVLLASHFQSALESLGQVTGRNYTDELLNDIFSRFCIGK